LRITDLEKADIGQYWRDKDGVDWIVYEIDAATYPKIIFFSVPEHRRSNSKPLDKTAFSFEAGWEMVQDPLCSTSMPSDLRETIEIKL